MIRLRNQSTKQGLKRQKRRQSMRLKRARYMTLLDLDHANRGATHGSFVTPADFIQKKQKKAKAKPRKLRGMLQHLSPRSQSPQYQAREAIWRTLITSFLQSMTIKLRPFISPTQAMPPPPWRSQHL